MKTKILCVFIFSLVFSITTCFVYPESDMKKPSRIAVNLGTKYLKGEKYTSGDQRASDKGFLFGGSGEYKYQKQNNIYARVRGDYYQGKVKFATKGDVKTVDQKKRSRYERQLDAAVGYTFACCNDAILISPFVCLGWFYNNDKVTASGGFFSKRKFYGLLWMLGIDLNWKIYKNFEVGLVASVGTNLDSRYKITFKDPIFEEGSLSYDLKNRLCYEIIVPVNYCYNDWRFGLQFSHARKTFQFTGKNDSDKFILHTFGLAATGAYTF